MNFAIVDENNRVGNLAVSESPLAGNWIPTDSAAIGDLYDPATGSFTREEIPPQVPAVVSRRQAKQQLLSMGLLDQVAPLIEALPDDGTRAMMRIYWEDSQEFERNHESLIALATALGLDAAALDAAFIAAAAR